MAIVKSKELVAAVQDVQREALQNTNGPKHMAIMRLHDPTRPDYYKPTASYSAQIRNHGARIGADSSERIIMPSETSRFRDITEQLVEDPSITGVMGLYPFSHDRSEHRDRVEIFKDVLRRRPEVDVDDILAQGKGAPTARAMIAMGNVCTGMMVNPGGQPYYVGRTLDSLSTLDLPQNLPDGKAMTADNIRVGGRGELTGGPLVNILAAQGVIIQPNQIATYENPGALANLPEHAFVFTATPVAEQIRNEDIPDDSIMIDAGFGVVDGVTYGNTSRHAATRPSVLWTPPREGVGPVSTSYLYENMLGATSFPMDQMPALGFVMLDDLIDYADR